MFKRWIYQETNIQPSIPAKAALDPEQYSFRLSILQGGNFI